MLRSIKIRNFQAMWLERTNALRQQQSRRYGRSAALCDEENATKKTEDDANRRRLKNSRKHMASDFNRRRAAYNRRVSEMRKQYAAEVAEQRAADEAEAAAEKRELTRKRLERQRKKNIRSAQAAIRQKEIREERAAKFEEHLRVQQEKRDAQKKRFAAARQLVVDELEEEAPLWLTTPEEVEAAFATTESEQRLWAKPGGILGAPNPSLDCHFWQCESHTWHMDRTYKSQRDVLLEELEEMAYEQANIDADFWTAERLEERQKLEDRARLRAMVHSAGRAELLKKQKQMIEEQINTVEDNEVPQPKPANNLKMLKDDAALEREGARLLMEDPTKFFVFSNQSEIEEDDASISSGTYHGPTLGAPVALRDVLREGSHQNKVFPQMIGKFPKEDTRTEREKKQQEREERLWAAAQREQQESSDIEMAAENQSVEDLQPDIDYNEINWDSDDEEWNKGLDPEADKAIMNTPRERRYREEDISWVSEKLQGKIKHLEQQFGQDMENLKQQLESELREMAVDAADNRDGSEAGAAAETAEEGIERALLSLSDRELMALSDLDDRYHGYEGEIPLEELSSAIEDIPNLTAEQLQFILSRDRSVD